MRDLIPDKTGAFTGVERVALEPTLKPFVVQVLEGPGWKSIGGASSQAAAEAIARGHRIDHRGSKTRITERRHPGGYAYIAR